MICILLPPYCVHLPLCILILPINKKDYYSQCKEICFPLAKPGKCTARSFFP